MKSEIEKRNSQSESGREGKRGKEKNDRECFPPWRVEVLTEQAGEVGK